MKAYIYRNEKGIEPFGEKPRDCLIGGKPLRILQEEVFLSLGIEITKHYLAEDSDEVIAFGDDLYFTKELLEEFIIRSRKEQNPATCLLKEGIITLRTVVTTQGIKYFPEHKGYNYDLQYFPAGAKKSADKCYPVIIEPDIIYGSLPVPSHICDNGNYQVPITDKFIIRINHWTNLWAANLITVLSEMARWSKAPWRKLFFPVLKAHSFNQWKILSKVNKIGQNCDIHPTAYIEGSAIGNNVKVGAGAVVRESIVGDNAFIGNSVPIEESVIGKKCVILNGHILYSVLYPGVFSVAHMISASIIGKDGFMGSNVVLTDFRLDGKNVIVVKDDTEVDTQNTFIGCCLGHNVYLGAGCVVAPGRMVQNNSRIAPEKIIKGNSPKNMSGFKLVREFAEVSSFEEEKEEKTKVKVKTAA